LVRYNKFSNSAVFRKWRSLDCYLLFWLSRIQKILSKNHLVNMFHQVRIGIVPNIMQQSRHAEIIFFFRLTFDRF